jgi:hypothetical protein
MRWQNWLDNLGLEDFSVTIIQLCDQSADFLEFQNNCAVIFWELVGEQPQLPFFNERSIVLVRCFRTVLARPN